MEHFKTDLTAGDRRSQAAQWAADETWVRCRKYENDPEYMECVKDILAHPVFNSMDQYIQHGDTTCKTHCIQVSYTTGIPMPGRRGSIFTVSPIPAGRWRMRACIFN